MTVRTYALSAIVFALGISLTGCGGPTEYAVVGSARAAGADGTVEVEEIEGGNNLVTLTLNHLPPPDRLGNGMTVYVLWVVGEGAAPTNAGRLEYDPDERTGKGVATTPLHAFEIKVTAEESVEVGSPSEIVVATQEVQRGD